MREKRQIDIFCRILTSPNRENSFGLNMKIMNQIRGNKSVPNVMVTIHSREMTIW